MASNGSTEGSFLNTNLVNPYDLLADLASEEVLGQYMRQRMCIGFPDVGDSSFGDVFWEAFLALAPQLKTRQTPEGIVAVYDKLRSEFVQLARENRIDFQLGIAAGRSDRPQRIATEIGVLVQQSTFSPYSTYLDIGCGDGILTKAVAETLGMPLRNTFGVEIGARKEKISGIHRFSFDGVNIPAEIPDVDLVTVVQVLHHTASEDQAIEILRNISCRLKSGAFLVVKDNNVESEWDRKWWHVRHLLPIRVTHFDPPYLVTDSVYKSAREWRRMLEKLGMVSFRLEIAGPYKEFAQQGNTNYSFYLVMRKP